MIQGASFLENDSNKAKMKLQLVHELWKSAKTTFSTRLENYHAQQTYYAFNFNCERERLRTYFDKFISFTKGELECKFFSREKSNLKNLLLVQKLNTDFVIII